MASYLFVAFLMVPYYNWQYATNHGFVAWLFFGEFIATAKGMVWPYFVFAADRGTTQTATTSERILEYTDNRYDYGFQYPSDWRIQPTPPPGEAGEIRVLVMSPRKVSNVMAVVGIIGNSVTREQFEGNPNRDALVMAMIDLSVEQVYKKVSRSVGADSIIVSEKRPLASDVGIKFYIATGHVIAGKGMMAVAGTHIIPFGKEYMVSFLMTTLVDPKATEENTTITNIFNSFHVLGERPK
jgi:hypothetical protein